MQRTERAPEVQLAGGFGIFYLKVEQVLHPWKYLEIASCLDLLGDASRPGQTPPDPRRAESFRQQAAALREKVLGKPSPDAPDPLPSIAFLEEDRMRKEAWKISGPDRDFERVQELQKIIQGWTLLEVASCFNLLGDAHRQRWHAFDLKYRRAEPLLQRALALREEILGKHHPDVATSLHNLAYFYEGVGQYEQARLLHERALVIREAAFGQNHPDVATSLQSLGNLFASQGQYLQAEPLLQRALSIREAALGQDHPDVATSLHALGQLFASQGNTTQAEPLHQRALAIREAALGKDHPDVSTSLHSLANLYASRRRYTRAEPLHQRALAIREAAFGKSHSEVAASLDTLASFYVEQGHLARAEPLLERALAIRNAARFKSHPEVITSLHHLARLRLARQNIDGALPLIQQALALSEEKRPEFGISEERLSNSLSHFREEEEYLYTLVLNHPDDPRIRHLALSAALFRKGRTVEEVASISRILHSGREGDPDFERLRSLRTQIAMLSLAGPGSLFPADYQQSLEDFAQQGATLESFFHGGRKDHDLDPAMLDALNNRPRIDPADPAASVAEVIPPDGALIEFIAYSHHPLIPRPGAAASRNLGGRRYLALLLFADRSIRAVDLGPAEPMEHAALRLSAALATPSTSYQPAARALYELAFRPLVPFLGQQVKRLFISPDGQLALVPFAALHDGRRFLVDAWDMTYLLSGRELRPHNLALPAKNPPSYVLRDPSAMRDPHSVVVLADPDFSSSPVTPAVDPLATQAPADAPVLLERYFSALRSELADQPWPPLPGTRKEAETIRRLFPEARVLLGSTATKEALLKLGTPAILHIATHGFFLEDVSPSRAARAVGHFGTIGDKGPPQLPADPLLRSGLVLAGARARAEQRGSGGALVTALELSGLDLWGTQLVVLSACDTGRGDIQFSQGVHGLRSALLMAGAETLVTSLWKINDETTQELMALYYRRLQAGQGRTAALREAMQLLRLKYPHPHFWAPFISIGQDGPLKGLSQVTPAQPH